MGALTDTVVTGLKNVLLEHPGECPVYLHVGQKVLRLPPQYNADSSNGLVGELRVLLGADALV
jgi:hypothetical protein